MSGSIVSTAHVVMHRTEMVVGMMSGTVRADRMMMMVPIAVVPIYIRCHAVVRMPPSRPIVPIVRRVPACPSRSPEPVVDIWSIDIYGFDDVVGTIDILVTYHLNSHALGGLVFLYIDRCDILIDVFCQYGLQDYQVTIAVGSLYHTQIINCAISIEVEV